VNDVLLLHVAFFNVPQVVRKVLQRLLLNDVFLSTQLRRESWEDNPLVLLVLVSCDHKHPTLDPAGLISLDPLKCLHVTHEFARYFEALSHLEERPALHPVLLMLHDVNEPGLALPEVMRVSVAEEGHGYFDQALEALHHEEVKNSRYALDTQVVSEESQKPPSCIVVGVHAFSSEELMDMRQVGLSEGFKLEAEELHLVEAVKVHLLEAIVIKELG